MWYTGVHVFMGVHDTIHRDTFWYSLLLSPQPVGFREASQRRIHVSVGIHETMHRHAFWCVLFLSPQPVGFKGGERADVRTSTIVITVLDYVHRNIVLLMELPVVRGGHA